MPPDDSVPPGGDWEFPPVDPADDLIGWTPEPALPEPALPEPPTAAADPEPALPEPPTAAADLDPEPALHPDPLPPPEPPSSIPEPPIDVFAGIGAPLLAAVEEPPSAGVLPVPRRTSVPGAPVSPVRALAGAAVAVAGILLGIGALLWATDAPKGSPALQQTQADSAIVSPSPSLLPSPSSAPRTAVTAPLTGTGAASPTPAAAPKLALTVLNNSNVNQLAHRAAFKYRAKGWPIKLEGAFNGRIPVTTVYYAPGQQASAQLLQKQFPAIARVRPRFDGLPGTGLTVVLTRDYPA